MDDLFGLGEDKWWERLLSKWERVPNGMRTLLMGGLIGLVILSFFVVLSSWGQMPAG